MDTTEHWLPVPNFTNIYEVSDHGQVRSLTRVVVHNKVKGTTKTIHGKVLAHAVDRKGYHLVCLSVNGKNIQVRVHRLVLQAFKGPCPPGKEGCHWDNNPGNNRLTNLRWDTSVSNNFDKVRHGTHPWARHARCPREHQLILPNLCTWSLVQRARRCLACEQTRVYCRDRKRARLAVPDFRTEADRRYALITAVG